MAVLSTLGTFSSSAAAAEPVASPETSNVVRLTVAADARAASELEAIARELLGRLELRVEFRRVARVQTAELRQPARGYFARVWIALSADGNARLYLEHSARDRLLLREVAGDAQNPELLREELGHILQAALEGLKAGEEIGAPRQEALAGVEATPAAAPDPPPRAQATVYRAPPPRERPPAFRFGPRYELVLLAEGGAIADGPGAAVWLTPPSRPRWGLELFGTYHRPFHREQAPIGARFQSWTVGALLTFEAWRGERSRLRLGAGAAADILKVTPFEVPDSSGDVELSASAWRKLALGRATLTYSHQLTTFMALDATLGAEADASGSRYVLRAGDVERELLAPWPLRPLLSLGVSVP